MYMRIVRAHPRGSADEVAERWSAFWPDKLRGMAGFRHAHFGIDRSSGGVAGVMVFDQRPDQAEMDRLTGEFQQQLGGVGPAGGPEVAHFEVVAEA
jgi:hypothetical protein